MKLGPPERCAVVARHTVYAVCDVGAVGGGWIIAYQ